MRRRKRQRVVTDLTVEQSLEVERPITARLSGPSVRGWTRQGRTSRDQRREGMDRGGPGQMAAMSRKGRNTQVYLGAPERTEAQTESTVDAAPAAGKGKASKGVAPVGTPTRPSEEPVAATEWPSSPRRRRASRHGEVQTRPLGVRKGPGGEPAHPRSRPAGKGTEVVAEAETWRTP